MRPSTPTHDQAYPLRKTGLCRVLGAAHQDGLTAPSPSLVHVLASSEHAPGVEKAADACFLRSSLTKDCEVLLQVAKTAKKTGIEG